MLCVCETVDVCEPDMSWLLLCVMVALVVPLDVGEDDRVEVEVGVCDRLNVRDVVGVLVCDPELVLAWLTVLLGVNVPLAVLAEVADWD